MLPAKKCGQKLCVVGGVFFVFVSPSKKSGCCSLAVFRSWNCLFFLFEIETLETSPFRAWKKEKEKKKSSGLPLAWLLLACLLLTFPCICRLQGSPGQPGLGSWVSNNKHSLKKNFFWQLKEETTKICPVLLVFELLVKAEEKMHLLVLLHPVAYPPFQAFSHSSQSVLLPSSGPALGAFLPLEVTVPPGILFPYSSLGEVLLSKYGYPECTEPSFLWLISLKAGPKFRCPAQCLWYQQQQW